MGRGDGGGTGFLNFGLFEYASTIVSSRTLNPFCGVNAIRKSGIVSNIVIDWPRPSPRRADLIEWQSL